MSISHPPLLQIIEAFVRRWSELVKEELRKDQAKFSSQSDFDQLYVQAYWKKWAKLMCNAHEGLERSDNPESQWALIEDVFAAELDLPSSRLKSDVENRMAWLKRMVAKEFEREIKKLIDRHDVVSPLEQIFLMEWKYAQLDEKLGVSLEPQKPVTTTDGNFSIDFAVSPKSTDKPGFIIGVEIDGHDFHEKTKEQAVRDKSRERAIVRAGITVLRFSGSEVYRNARRCVEEVAEMISDRLRRET